MKKLFLALFSTLLLLPATTFAALDCATYPDDTECLCYLDTGGEPAGPEDVIVTVQDSVVECQQTCDDVNASFYQFNECVDGAAVLGASISLENLTVYAEPVVDSTTDSTVTPPIIPNLNVPIPGVNLEGSVTKTGGLVSSNLLSRYIDGAYRYLLIAGSIMAVVMLMVGGLEYTTSAGNSKRLDKAKHRISNALIGLVLLFAAFNLAYLIDPRTTTFRSLDLQSIQAEEIDNETPDSFTENFTPATQAGEVNIPLYNQKQYASSPYGPASCLKADSGNIKSSGCGVTSFAMVAAGLSGRIVSPIDVAESFYQEGFRPIGNDGCGYNGTKYDAFTQSSLLSQYGLKGRLIPKEDHAQLLDLIKTNHIIITSYRTDSGGGHYVVISGMDSNGNLIVSNPWGGTRETRSVDWWFARIKSATYVDKESDFIQ